MKILALSDEEVGFIYNTGVRALFGEVGLIVGCGDLPARYLEYVVTQLNVPLVYVPGNHDPDDLQVPGGRNVDGSVVQISGLTVGGLGGSRRYKLDGRHQYTESQMQWRVAQLGPRLALKRLLRGRGLDLFITHAPPLGIHDGPDHAHVGFAAFRSFVSAFRPTVMLHGHSHVQRNLEATDTRLLSTRILNVFPYRVIDWPEAQ
jgi:Icc-related predicted phosphoesterase